MSDGANYRTAWYILLWIFGSRYNWPCLQLLGQSAPQKLSPISTLSCIFWSVSVISVDNSFVGSDWSFLWKRSSESCLWVSARYLSLSMTTVEPLSAFLMTISLQFFNVCNADIYSLLKLSLVLTGLRRILSISSSTASMYNYKAARLPGDGFRELLGL
jgi:hypothetical protein